MEHTQDMYRDKAKPTSEHAFWNSTGKKNPGRTGSSRTMLLIWLLQERDVHMHSAIRQTSFPQ